MQFTIEARQLTNEWTRRSAVEAAPRTRVIEASDADDAISQFVRESDAQLVSFMRPVEGRESIATIRKNDSVFLVRVYEE